MEDLIYDRTQDDLSNKTSKGFHNYKDINRVEEWCRYLADLLTSYGYSVYITTKTNWAMTDKRTESEMERIRKNIGKIKDAYYLAKDTPELPGTINPITWQKANDIEKILYDIDLLIKGMKQVFVYSGVASCGQNRIWQQRFRRYTKSLKQWLELTQVYWNEFSETETWEDIIYD